MKVPGHIAISISGAWVVHIVTHSIGASIAFLISGVLTDIDHYIDYARENGLSFDIKKIYKTCEHGHKAFKRLTLFLHSYEIILCLWIYLFLNNPGVVWQGAIWGFTIHLLTDQVTNKVVPLAYFLTFRASNNFDVRKLFREEVYYASGNR